MNNLNEILSQNNLSIKDSIIEYAHHYSLNDSLSELESNLNLTVESITNLILSISINDIHDYESLSIIFTSFFNFTDFHDCNSMDLDKILECVKYYKRGYNDFITSYDLDDVSKTHYNNIISIFFDSLEIYLSQIWVKQFKLKFEPTLDVDKYVRYQIVVENSLNPIIIIDFDKTIYDMNTTARKLFYEINGEYFYQGTVESVLPWLTNNFSHLVKSNNNSLSFEQAFYTKKGAKYFDIKLIKTSTSDLRRNEIAVIMNNITGYKKMTKEITESKQRYQSLFKNMFEACSYNKLIVDEENNPIDFIILDVNEALLKSVGLKRDELISKNGLSVFSFLNVADFNWLSNFGRAAINGDNIRIKELYLESINKWYSISIYSSEDGYFAFVYTDISEKKQAEENVLKLAYYDVLTGLPNSKQLDDKIKEAINEAIVFDRKFAVMFIDISNFKKINNTLGHKTGDAMLTQIADRLKSIAKPHDTVAKLGGDKFVIVKNRLAEACDAESFAEEIIDILKAPFTFNEHEFFIEVNIGISIFPTDAEHMHTLKRNADTAMFMAKKNNTKRYMFHTKDMNERALRNLVMEADLRKAIQKNQLSLHYQPLVNIASGSIIAFEALLRWEHPVTGMISPVEFIPIAEENGLIIPIGEWVLNAAVKQCKEWQDHGYDDIYISVNVSINQLEQLDFIDKVTKVLFETRLDPKFLIIEITESVYMQHLDMIIDTLTKLNNLGITLSLDDFGTGYSSLNYLSKLPINTLKIDKSFISHMDTNSDYSILTRAIIKMAHSLNLDVVAEGVETFEELALLKEHNCDKIQGFLFSRPIPSEAVEDILAIRRNLYIKH
jgi:diguanylate cyclase (GGDEF)-like protein